MEQLTLSISKMWADHHVLAVREVLTTLEGVGDIEASAALKSVCISYDPAIIGQDGILQALRKAGFDPAEAAEFPEPVENKDGESAWFAFGMRVTQTNRLDLEMSGDFRKY